MAFSIVNRDSFDNIKTAWYPEYQEHLKDAQIILVGTKKDLVEDDIALRMKRMQLMKCFVPNSSLVTFKILKLQVLVLT